MSGLEPLAVAALAALAVVSIVLGLVKMYGSARYANGYDKRDREWLAIVAKTTRESREAASAPILRGGDLARGMGLDAQLREPAGGGAAAVRPPDAGGES